MPLTREEILREYIRDIENRRIPQIKEDIAPFERGEMQVRSHTGTEWIDDTPAAIERSKKAIEQYERILANLKKELA
jgi:hypothetical protein